MKRIFFPLFLLLITAASFTFLTHTITGIITDDAGKPVIAYVTIKNSQKKISTGKDGNFSIEVKDSKAVLIISAAGYISQEITVQQSTILAITLMRSSSIVMKADTLLYDVRKIKEERKYSARKFSPLAATGNIRGHEMALGGNIMSGSLGYYDREYAPAPKRYHVPGSNHLNTEGYDAITDNPFRSVNDNPLSTFSIDVDAASYSNIRRILNSGQLPPKGAVRIEEMINYFTYEYAQPTGKDPFAVYTELAVCPWNKDHQLAMIGLQARKIDVSDLPPSNLTFLIDVSGSMLSGDKLPLVQASLKLLVNQLRPQDKISIVVYAGNAGLILEPTAGDHKEIIKEAIDRLQAGGSTAGGQGIQLAYKIARQNFSKEKNNRVILCTDGDFNVGLSSDDGLEELIERERKSGVFLTVLGYGTGNYQDAKMQKLADKGNGNHAYIDGIAEAKKVLINEFGGTLFTIAKDVKLQVEFNPAKVKAYRLIGYENRVLAKEDFNNDTKDAGELGSGHTVTALYELIPPGVDMPGIPAVDSLRYQTYYNAISTAKSAQFGEEVMNIKLRYKQPDGDISKLSSFPVKKKMVRVEEASCNLRFAAAVASFGMLLRDSEYKGDISYAAVLALAKNALGDDKESYRKQFIQLVNAASSIQQKKTDGPAPRS